MSATANEMNRMLSNFNFPLLGSATSAIRNSKLTNGTMNATATTNILLSVIMPKIVKVVSKLVDTIPMIW